MKISAREEGILCFPNFVRFLPLGDLLGIRVRKHYSRCKNIWANIIIFYCLTVLGQEDLVRHYFPILSIKLSWQVNTVRDLSSKVFHRCRNKLFKIIFVLFRPLENRVIKEKKIEKDGVRFLVPFAGEVCSKKNFPSKLNSLKILLFHDLSDTCYHIEQRVKYRFQLSSFDLTLRWIVARCTYMLCNVTLLPSFSGNCFHHASCCISLFLWKLITGKLVNTEINQCSYKKKKNYRSIAFFTLCFLW